MFQPRFVGIITRLNQIWFLEDREVREHLKLPSFHYINELV